MIPKRVDLILCAKNICFESVYRQLCSEHLLTSNMVLFIGEILESRVDVPISDEQPGPPFSHKVTGSLFFGPLIDSTKT